MKIKFIKTADILVVVTILTICLCGYYFLHEKENKNNLTAVVTIDGKIYKEISIGNSSETNDISGEIVTPTNPKTVISYDNHSVWFSFSECKNQLCVRSGKLSSPGATAVCLPARVVVSIVADKHTKDRNSFPDAVTY